MTGLLVIVIAYLVGGIPFGYLLVRMTTGKDVRAAGSGNIGATNVLRTTGRVAGVVTLVLDIAKGFVAVWLAAYLTDGSTIWTGAAAEETGILLTGIGATAACASGARAYAGPIFTSSRGSGAPRSTSSCRTSWATKTPAGSRRWVRASRA